MGREKSVLCGPDLGVCVFFGGEFFILLLSLRETVSVFVG